MYRIWYFNEGCTEGLRRESFDVLIYVGSIKLGATKFEKLLH